MFPKSGTNGHVFQALKNSNTQASHLTTSPFFCISGILVSAMAIRRAWSSCRACHSSFRFSACITQALGLDA
jgi:hypothetical protein